MKLFSYSFVCSILFVPCAFAAVGACVETTPMPRLNLNSDLRGSNWWVRLHNDRLANVCRQGGEVDVVLLGDSITHYWDHKPYAFETWNEFTNAYKVLNFGYAGDRTQHLLWRVRNGELDGYRTKSVVLMIGTNNNTDKTTSPANVAAGVKAVLDEIAVRQPQAKVLLLPIFPRGFGADDAHHAAARRRNDETNKLIQKFADGSRIQWLDFTDQFIDPATGWTTKELFPDRIHPGALGCRIWLEAMKPHLDAFCGRPDPIVVQTGPNLSVEGKSFEIGVLNYTPTWSSLPMKDHFRSTGGWTRLADGRLRGDLQLTCIKPCDLNVLCLSARFPIAPVIGRTWTADAVSRTLPAKLGPDFHLGSGKARVFLFPLPDGRTLRAEFEEPTAYRAQDSRQWGPNWGVRLGGCQARRTYAVGDTVAFKVTLSTMEGFRLVSPTPCTIGVGPKWVKLDYRKDPAKGSALDWTDMALQDAPAGKYGWLKNVNGHFEFEGKPGVEQRFYGVNLCFDANYPSHADAELLVERLVRCGYNTVRVHHHDRRWIQDDDSRDRLDYLIAQCLARGLYITTDLYVSRRANYRDIGIDKDGVVENIDEYKKAVAKYDLAFKDWCAFTERFLKHVNPYTQRAYLDEPGLPLISLINEGGESRVVWEKCSAFVRSLGARALLTNDNDGGRHGEGEGVTPGYDYVDSHFYVDHPQFIERNWSLPSRCRNENPIRVGQPGIFNRGWAKGASKPYTITEWNFSGPGRYRAIGGILTGALASEQDWDGLWRFAYSHSDRNWRDSPYSTPGYFDCVTDPLSAASDRASVCLYLRRDAGAGALALDREQGSMRLVTPRTCGCFTEGGTMTAGPLVADVAGAPATVWVSSLDSQPVAASSRLLLVHLTDVQGAGARYADQNRQTLLKWGRGCVVEDGTAKISLRLDAPQNCMVYELDTAGTRVGTVPATVKDGALAFEATTRGPNGGRIYYEIVRK